MNGCTKKGTAGWLAVGLLATTGCCGTYNDLVDPCYPARYNCIAREEVRAPLETQANNGLMLDQTLYVHYFKNGSAELLPGGQVMLARIARRMPHPEPAIFVKTAQPGYDLDYVAGKEDEFSAKRKELDEQRRQSVLAFMKMERPDVPFTVAISNPHKIGISGREGSLAAQQMQGSAIGSFSSNIGGGSGTGGGSGGGGGSSGK